MIVGAKLLTWAPFTSGGAGGAITYGTGSAETDKVVRVDMSEERADTGFYADDKRIDRDNSITAASVSIETAQLTLAMRESILGHVKATNDYTVTDAASPFVGVGFCLKQRYKGAVTYRAYWYHKVQFGMDSDSAETKGENSAFQSVNLTGSIMGVQLTSGGAMEFYMTKSDATEAAIRTWLNGLAGISTTT